MPLPLRNTRHQSRQVGGHPPEWPASLRDRPIVRPVHPGTGYLEACSLPQWHDASLPACDPVIHVSGLDPVVPKLNLHDVEYPLAS
jgi:hypothetical protein